MSTQETTTQVVKNSAMISAYSALGFASALLIDILIAARFGLSQQTDAFFVAFTIPQLIASILLVAFSVVLVPLLSKVIIEEGKPSLWRISSNMANLSLLGLGALGVIGSLSAPLLIRILGAGLDRAAQELAISLSTWLFLMVIPLGAVEVFKATLNSLRIFAFPAATVLMRNSVTLLTVVLLSRSLGISALVVGYVLGAWFQLFFLGLALLTRGFRYHFVFEWREPRTAEALRNLRHPVAGAILGQSNILIERFLASFLPVGLVSALVYARRILRAVDYIFIGSISTAFLPRLSTQTAQNRLVPFRQSLVLAVKLTVFVSMPVAIGIMTLSERTVTVLFQRGAFDQSAVNSTAMLLTLYVIGIPAIAILQILNASYYALGDTKTPFYSRLVMLGLYGLLAFLLFYLLQASGLALALTLSRVITALVITWLLNRQLGFLDSDLIAFAAKISVASALMGGVLLGLQAIDIRELQGLGSLFSQVFWLAIAVAIGVGVYILLLLLLRVPEVRRMTELIRVSSNRVRFKPRS